MSVFARHYFSNNAQPCLYPVVDHVNWLARLLPLGIKTIQLRIKQAPLAVLRAQITGAVALGKDYNAAVFINDHWQLALECGAYGVHLGQEDMLTADLSAIVSAGLRLGISTRTDDELEAALELAPSYIAIGHIFPTPTKQMTTPPQGVDKLKQHIRRINHRFSTVAIGGIDLTNAADVCHTGVDAIAVVRAVTHSTCLEESLTAFSQIFANGNAQC